MLTQLLAAEYGEAFAKYIGLVPEVDLREMLAEQLEQTTELFANLSESGEIIAMQLENGPSKK